jgi:NitT/TauT family transport system permease protein
MFASDAFKQDVTPIDTVGHPARSSLGRRAGSALLRCWSGAAPRLAAVALVLLAWQVLVWQQWRPSYVLPGPAAVGRRLLDDLSSGVLFDSVHVTMQRALEGYALALLIGTIAGLAVSRVRLLRAAFGSIISGLQSMPSVAWFPLAILLFKVSESAILFVVVLGASPAIANGMLSAVDHIPPLLLRAGRVLGARRLSLTWYVLLPAAMPGYVAGLKQGWAFAWRSLLAGELLVIVAHRSSIGVRLQFARELSDAEGLIAWMIIILFVGVLVDSSIFAPIQHRLREQRGLIERDG